MPDDEQTAAGPAEVVPVEAPVGDASTSGDVPGGSGADAGAGDAVPAAPQYVAYGLMFVIGLITGMFGVAIAPVRVTVGDVHLPIGLLVVVAIPVIARAGAWLSGSRLGAACVAVGWALPTLAFVLLDPGGDVLLPDVPRTWIYLVGTALLLLLASVVRLPRGAAALADARRAGRPDATG